MYAIADALFNEPLDHFQQQVELLDDLQKWIANPHHASVRASPSKAKGELICTARVLIRFVKSHLQALNEWQPEHAGRIAVMQAALSILLASSTYEPVRQWMQIATDAQMLARDLTHLPEYPTEYEPLVEAGQALLVLCAPYDKPGPIGRASSWSRFRIEHILDQSDLAADRDHQQMAPNRRHLGTQSCELSGDYTSSTNDSFAIQPHLAPCPTPPRFALPGSISDRAATRAHRDHVAGEARVFQSGFKPPPPKVTIKPFLATYESARKTLECSDTFTGAAMRITAPARPPQKTFPDRTQTTPANLFPPQIHAPLFEQYHSNTFPASHPPCAYSWACGNKCSNEEIPPACVARCHCETHQEHRDSCALAWGYAERAHGLSLCNIASVTPAQRPRHTSAQWPSELNVLRAPLQATIQPQVCPARITIPHMPDLTSFPERLKKKRGGG
jgi:hypothetical protein